MFTLDNIAGWLTCMFLGAVAFSYAIFIFATISATAKDGFTRNRFGIIHRTQEPDVPDGEDRYLENSLLFSFLAGFTAYAMAAYAHANGLGLVEIIFIGVYSWLIAIGVMGVMGLWYVARTWIDERREWYTFQPAPQGSCNYAISFMMIISAGCGLAYIFYQLYRALK